MNDIRADSRIASSQWESSLQSNAVSHWLGTNLESALDMKKTYSYFKTCPWFCCALVRFDILVDAYDSFYHILQCRCTVTRAIVWLPQSQWSNPEGYGYNWPVPKHNKARTICTILPGSSSSPLPIYKKYLKHCFLIQPLEQEGRYQNGWRNVSPTFWSNDSWTLQ